MILPLVIVLHTEEDVLRKYQRRFGQDLFTMVDDKEPSIIVIKANLSAEERSHIFDFLSDLRKSNLITGVKVETQEYHDQHVQKRLQ